MVLERRYGWIGQCPTGTWSILLSNLISALIVALTEELGFFAV